MVRRERRVGSHIIRWSWNEEINIISQWMLFLPELVEVHGGEEGEACWFAQDQVVVERGDRLQQAVDGLNRSAFSNTFHAFFD